jgi:outer membrane lipoprotein-sorting protein
MKKLILILIALLMGLPSLPALAEAPPPKPASLSAREQSDVERIEAYLNKLKSVSAEFLQVSDNGALRHGTIKIRRPGEMRVKYDPPNEDLIVADGSFLHLWDDQMQQQSSIPIGSGVASFILRDKISLSGDIIVTRFVRYPAKIELDLISKETPEEGELTLVFEDKPLKLRQWRVLDTQGHTTGVNLENAQEDVDFPSGTFNFVPPNIGKSSRNPQK